MRQIIAVLVVVAVLAWGTSAVVARDGEFNEPIPSCDQDDWVMISILTQSFLADYAEMSSSYAEKMTDIMMQSTTGIATLKKISALQLEWWSEIVPALPRCTAAVDFTRVIGHQLNELMTVSLIMALYLDQPTFLDEMGLHADAYTQATDDFIVLNALLAEYAS